MLGAPQGGPTLAQLFELRMVVECACAGMAAQRGSGNDLQAIRAALADMRRHAEDFASAAAAGPFRQPSCRQRTPRASPASVSP